MTPGYNVRTYGMCCFFTCSTASSPVPLLGRIESTVLKKLRQVTSALLGKADTIGHCKQIVVLNYLWCRYYRTPNVKPAPLRHISRYMWRQGSVPITKRWKAPLHNCSLSINCLRRCSLTLLGNIFGCPFMRENVASMCMCARWLLFICLLCKCFLIM